MTYTYTSWTKDLETGNRFIDDQHKKLIDALNALYDAHRGGLGDQEIEKTMGFLVDYTLMHFDEEEDLAARNNYPDYLRHKRLHDGFRDVARDLLNKLLDGPPTEDFIVSVYSTIGQWVISHIMGEDFKLAAFLKAKWPKND
ncbi:MAG: bacteriohemerythrin [Holophagaceae bacterium]|nr:bacteriohemerythrin [Holophagaceae bacterium]